MTTDRFPPDEPEKNDQPSPQTSLLFERYSIWFLLAGLVLAIWFQFVPVIVVSIFLIFLSGILMVWRRQSLIRMEPALQLSKSRLFANQDFHLTVSLFNNKWLPLPWVEWEFPKNKGIVLGHHETDTYLVRFLWLLWYQRIQWDIHGRAMQRGVHEIGNIRLRSGDGFRFSEVEQEYRLDAKLHVYPALVPVSVSTFQTSMQWGIKGKQGGFLEDPLLVNGIREYQDGDEMRRFNWKASARTGKLQTNTYQPVVVEQLIVCIDVHGFQVNTSGYQEEDLAELKKSAIKKREDFERMLSVIASVIVEYHRLGKNIGLISNGQNPAGRKMPPIPPSTHLTPMLDQLAEITLSPSTATTDMLDEMVVKREGTMPFFVFCEKVTNSHYTWYEQNKQKLSGLKFFYLCETDSAKRLPASQPLEFFLTHQ